jgi:hypothetical protein
MISWLASSEALSLRNSPPKFPYSAALKATERNVEATREGTVVLTHKLLGLAQRNSNTALNLITKSLNAKSFAELIELNFMHSFNQFYALFRQADELGIMCFLRPSLCLDLPMCCGVALLRAGKSFPVWQKSMSAPGADADELRTDVNPLQSGYARRSISATTEPFDTCLDPPGQMTALSLC